MRFVTTTNSCDVVTSLSRADVVVVSQKPTIGKKKKNKILKNINDFPDKLCTLGVKTGSQ